MPDIMQTSIKSLPLVYRGKVRECYAVGEDKLLMIATDRISAFDVILSVPIPKKGKVLTAMPKENKLLVEGVNVATCHLSLIHI